MSAVAAVLERLPSRLGGTHTPGLLRRWRLATGLTALALIAATSPLMAHTQAQARIIGAEAGPQVATASELYFVLSDLDAQVARLVLINHDEQLSSSQLDALSTYRERSDQINDHLAAALDTAVTDADRTAIVGIMNKLASYRQWAWQALTVGRVTPLQPEGDPPTEPSEPSDEPSDEALSDEAPPSAPGELPPAALGYYSRATNVAHFDLLPAVTAWREASEDRLDQAYADQRTTQWWGIGLVVLLGLALLAQLTGLQLSVTRRFRRSVNPELLAATVVTAGFMVATCTVFVLEGDRLGNARGDHLEPYLALADAQGISYDAAADTSRYLLGSNKAYDQSFAAKSACLTEGGPCGTSGDDLDDGLAGLAAAAGSTETEAQDLLERWRAYERGHEQIVALADTGNTADAIETLTGIQRGEAAFDFYYFDVAISDLAAERRNAFDLAMWDAEQLLSGWSVIPVAAMGSVILLLLLGLRRRLAEYRE